MAKVAGTIHLKPRTLKSFDDYIREAEVAMEQNLRDEDAFLWSDATAERARQVREGQIVAQLWSGSGPLTIPDGLIHDWISAAFTAGVTVQETLALVQDYDEHRNIYQPEVVASKLIRQRGGDFQIYMRLFKKKIITVVLDTNHEVHYRSLDRTRCVCRSYTTRIAEVQNAGTPKEKVLPPDTGHGFLWRLYSYWRFQERDHGVFMECRAISLTRDVPIGLGWLLTPIVEKLPLESLIHTLECTRQALHPGAK